MVEYTMVTMVEHITVTMLDQDLDQLMVYLMVDQDQVQPMQLTMVDQDQGLLMVYLMVDQDQVQPML